MERDEYFKKAAHVLIGDLADQLRVLPDTQKTNNRDSGLHNNFLAMGIALLDFMAISIKAKNVSAGRDEFHPQLFYSYANSLLENAKWVYGKPRVPFNRSIFLENNICFTWVKDEVILPVLSSKPVLVTSASLLPSPTKPKPNPRHPFTVIPGGKDEPNPP